ncbi:MAG: right-handed parallel beta-helix repeat-containing protein [Aliidongia sp.]|jgi:hypothetical protein
MTTKRIVSLLCAGFILAMAAAPAWAQATRTFVSGVGDDANPCSRTAPCKTFAGAISKTAASGEINVLDPGGFGAITITKAITIANDGIGTAGVLVSGTNGIVISAGTSDAVILRGLQIDGLSPSAGAGLNGVSVLQAGSVIIDHCKIFGFQQNGVNFTPDNTSQLTILDTAIYNNGSSGGPLGNFGNVLIQGTGTGVNVTATLDRVQMINGFKPGLRVDGSATTGTTTVTVRDSLAQGNGGTGFDAQTEAPDNGTVMLTLQNSAASNNQGFGVHSTGTTAATFITGMVITGNGNGIGTTTSNIVSSGNNMINGNGTNGAPTLTTLLN